jgi:hypothetical protein
MHILFGLLGMMNSHCALCISLIVGRLKKCSYFWPKRKRKWREVEEKRMKMYGKTRMGRRDD